VVVTHDCGLGWVEKGGGRLWVRQEGKAGAEMGIGGGLEEVVERGRGGGGGGDM